MKQLQKPKKKKKEKQKKGNIKKGVEIPLIVRQDGQP